MILQVVPTAARNRPLRSALRNLVFRLLMHILCHPNARGIQHVAQRGAHVLVILFALAGTKIVLPSTLHAQVPATPAQPVLLDSMEGGQPAFRLANATNRIRMIDQRVLSNAGRNQGAAERATLSAPPGESAKLGYRLPRARVIEELHAHVWLRCNRPGVRLAIECSLPRTIDPETGQAFQLLLIGEQASQGHLWEKLEIAALPILLARRARVARSQHGSSIDERGAIAHRLVLLAPGGKGPTEVLVDEVALFGALSAGLRSRGSVSLASHESEPAQPSSAYDSDKPLVPRVLQWQGESFGFVRQIGFDAASLPRVATDEQLAEAREVGLYLVCPPPGDDQLSEGMGSKYDPVFAWDLGEIASEQDLDRAIALGRQLEVCDSQAQRPTFVRPLTQLRRASRVSDIVLLGKEQASTTLSLASYAAALSGQQRVTRPGSQFWVNLDTQIGPDQQSQYIALGGTPERLAVPYENLVAMTSAALGCRPSGFYVRSDESLEGSKPRTRQRAMAVQLTNLRLGLAKPWLASRKSAGAATTTNPEVTAMVLQAERSHLLLPMRWQQSNHGQQSGSQPGRIVGASDSTALSILASGIPESADAYLLAWSGSERLRTQRVTGGLRVTTEGLASDAMLLMTQDARAAAQVERYLRRHSTRTAQLRSKLVAYDLQAAKRALAELPDNVTHRARLLVATAGQHLALREEWLQRQDHKTLLHQVALAERALRRALAELSQPIATKSAAGELPVPVRWATLPMLLRLEQASASQTARFMRVPGGNFESLSQLLSTQWKHLQHEVPGLTTGVRLSGQAPYAQNYCLELDCQPQRGPTQQGSTHVPPVPTPPVWITSPTVDVPAGSVVEIRGMARVPTPPVGAEGELLIFDSLAGDTSAVRVRVAPSWQPFRLIRAVGQNRAVNLTLALGGVGEAQVDEIQYRILSLAAPSAGQVATPRTGPPQTSPAMPRFLPPARSAGLPGDAAR